MDQKRRHRLLSLTMLAAGVVTLATPSHAQPHDPALAQTLFDEATKLYEEGLKIHDNQKLAEACAKFGASHKTDPGYGAAFNLATCDETIGKTASAWAEFLEAAALAKTPADAADAKQRADALAPKLVRLKITVTNPIDGLVIKRDGAALDRAAWGSTVPVDPGSYRIGAEAPGRRSWSTTAKVEGEGKVITVEVPVLESSATASPSASSMTEAPRRSDDLHKREVVSPPSASSMTEAPRPFGAQRGIAIVLGSLGVVGFVVGGALAGTAKSKWDDAKPHCDELHRCDPFGLSTGTEARGLADGATGALIAGGVMLAAGVGLWLFAPRSVAGKPAVPRPNAAAWVGRESGGIVVRGVF